MQATAGKKTIDIAHLIAKQNKAIKSFVDDSATMHTVSEVIPTLAGWGKMLLKYSQSPRLDVSHQISIMAVALEDMQKELMPILRERYAIECKEVMGKNGIKVSLGGHRNSQITFSSPAFADANVAATSFLQIKLQLELLRFAKVSFKHSALPWKNVSKQLYPKADHFLIIL